jgi:tol-pal system protein YbgF
MNRLEKAMNDVSTQQQNLTQTLQSAPAGTPPNSAPTSMPPANSTGTPQAASPAPGTPLSTYAASLNTPPPSPAGRNGTSAGAPLVDDMYKSAFNDFMAARYAVASAEFNDLIKAYPDAPLAGNAWYYLGEIDYRGAHYSTAVKDYDKLLEQYPDNNKIPAAHLHKGEALVQMQLKEAGIREFRALIQRFPTSPEATQARTKLNAMGVAIRPKA